MDCSSSTGLVSWDAGQGNLSYLVQAVGADGYQAQCNSTNTSCSLLSLRCGQLYNLTCVGQDGRCNSNTSQATLQSGTQLHSYLQCGYCTGVKYCLKKISGLIPDIVFKHYWFDLIWLVITRKWSIEALLSAYTRNPQVMKVSIYDSSQMVTGLQIQPTNNFPI